ncbi:aquaporin-10a [Clupea harengus]|uniref:Aquaporin-10a n=1 Tax=Clupea harengus TaxID=7950 RepID=A0A8M1KRF6_CLUHA|nr:aquaporin-10a [Clupea harengus]
MKQVRKALTVKNELVRQCMGELLGTFVLLLFGCAAAAQVKTSRETKGQFLSANMAFSVGVMAAMYICKGVSGAHLNPAVSLSFCVLGQMSWKKLVPYSLSQLLGAYLASGLVFCVYYDAIMEFSGGVLTVTGPNETASIFATYPSEYVSLTSSFLDQVIGTAVLIVCSLALGDRRNSAAPTELEPLMVGLVIWVIGLSMGSNCGYPLNPARDLGPRVFTYLAGWGSEVFSAGNGWFWVPLVAPFVGALVGAALYYFFIEIHHPPLEESANGDALCIGNKILKLEVPDQDINALKSFKKDENLDNV